MSNKNNTPEQKSAWKTNQKLGSSLTRFIPSRLYNPQTKEPSKRDRRRVLSKERRIADLKRLGKQLLPKLMAESTE